MMDCPSSMPCSRGATLARTLTAHCAAAVKAGRARVKGGRGRVKGGRGGWCSPPEKTSTAISTTNCKNCRERDKMPYPAGPAPRPPACYVHGALSFACCCLLCVDVPSVHPSPRHIQDFFLYPSKTSSSIPGRGKTPSFLCILHIHTRC